MQTLKDILDAQFLNKILVEHGGTMYNKKIVKVALCGGNLGGFLNLDLEDGKSVPLFLNTVTNFI